ncbi:MAG TPA: MarR family winged helix-turn-helix transcriptional regulator [Candidatus Angelobacter sp.]
MSVVATSFAPPEKGRNGKAIRSPDPCIVLRSASRALTRFYDLVLAPSGMKSSQFIILYAIFEKSEIAQWELAKVYSISSEALSRRLSGLRRLGLIEMRFGPHHSERLYRLTEQGQDKLQAVLPFWLRAQERFLQIVGTSNWDLMLRTAAEAIGAAQAAETVRLANKTTAVRYL